MGHDIVETEAAPAAIGPYSQAVFAGNFLFTSGQIALDPFTGQMVGQGDVRAQTQKAMANLRGVIEAAGFVMSDLVKCTIYLVDMNDFSTVNEVYALALGSHRPARATVEVSRLPKDALVEIDAVALKSPGAS